VDNTGVVVESGALSARVGTDARSEGRGGTVDAGPDSPKAQRRVTASLLPIPDDPRFPALIAEWPLRPIAPGVYSPYPRSWWLGEFEALLREFYPSANSDSLTLTARHAAPFPLALGPDVP
jgi:hypothetical protein